ncbi:unnamed protein product [Bubo scandiacus]
MMVSPVNISDASEEKQDRPDIFHFQIEESVTCVFDSLSMKTPERMKAMLGENFSVDSLSIIPEKEISWLKSGSKRRTPKQKLQPVVVLSRIKHLRKTPQEELEPVTDEIGFPRLLKTPAQEGEAVKRVAGVTVTRKTPKLKYQPVDDMIGGSRIFNIPEENVELTDVEPIEHIFDMSTLVKTPREKYQPVISSSIPVAKSRGRRRRAIRCIQEEIVSQHPNPKEVGIDSFVEGLESTRRAGRGKGKKTAKLKHASESLESCGKAASVVQNQRANRKQTLQGSLDLAAETESSSSLQRKCDLSETDDKEEGTNEDQNMSLETVSCAKEKPLGRGRREETALASQTTNHISLRGKRRLPADNGREAAPKEYQNVPLETFDSPVKENQLRRGRRKDIALSLEATSSIPGKQGLSKERSRKKKLILDNPETPEEQQNILLEVAPSAKGNPSRVGRKRRISSKSEETTSAFLRENPVLPINRCQKRILKNQEVNPIQQATSTSRRRKCQLPADDLASKKSRSENDENRSLQNGRRNKAKEQLGEEGVRATRTTGGTDRKTRSSTRTSARARK